MHVPDENLTHYRRLKKLYRHVDNIGNKRSNRGDYSGANAAWRRAGRILETAQSLRVWGPCQTYDQLQGASCPDRPSDSPPSRR
jgi:hypothetical protein